MSFRIEQKLQGSRGRAGIITTAHGIIETPAFIVVGTKATVKALTPEQLSGLGTQAILANTYHLYLEPGERILQKAGGLHTFMNWHGPTFTDSGGFQAFSLGAAFGKGISKLSKVQEIVTDEPASVHEALAKVNEDGVEFKSIIDGSTHFFTPERSMEIQHAIGADIMFAFDECTSPIASYEYQKEAMDRTHRWAQRSLEYHALHKQPHQSLWGIVQGGRYEDLRKESARVISAMDFDGFGIGGSFDKEDLDTAVGWVVDELPENKPRHLLGIGEPLDLLLGMEHGIDTFDCVVPTRIARHGHLYTHTGEINVLNREFRDDMSPIERNCACYACMNYSRACIAHLLRVKEMLGHTLGSIHNVYFLVNLVKNGREAILRGNFKEFKNRFIATYMTSN